jgi:hypothetical protein
MIVILVLGLIYFYAALKQIEQISKREIDDIISRQLYELQAIDFDIYNPYRERAYRPYPHYSRENSIVFKADNYYVDDAYTKKFLQELQLILQNNLIERPDKEKNIENLDDLIVSYKQRRFKSGEFIDRLKKLFIFDINAKKQDAIFKIMNGFYSYCTYKEARDFYITKLNRHLALIKQVVRAFRLLNKLQLINNQPISIAILNEFATPNTLIDYILSNVEDQDNALKEIERFTTRSGNNFFMKAILDEDNFLYQKFFDNLLSYVRLTSDEFCKRSTKQRIIFNLDSKNKNGLTLLHLVLQAELYPLADVILYAGINKEIFLENTQFILDHIGVITNWLNDYNKENSYLRLDHKIINNIAFKKQDMKFSIKYHRSGANDDTLLIHALINGADDAAELLIEQFECDINAKSSEQVSVVFHSICLERHAITNLIIKKGADISLLQDAKFIFLSLPAVLSWCRYCMVDNNGDKEVMIELHKFLAQAIYENDNVVIFAMKKGWNSDAERLIYKFNIFNDLPEKQKYLTLEYFLQHELYKYLNLVLWSSRKDFATIFEDKIIVDNLKSFIAWSRSKDNYNVLYGFKASLCKNDNILIEAFRNGQHNELAILEQNFNIKLPLDLILYPVKINYQLTNILADIRPNYYSFGLQKILRNIEVITYFTNIYGVDISWLNPSSFIKFVADFSLQICSGIAKEHAFVSSLLYYISLVIIEEIYDTDGLIAPLKDTCLDELFTFVVIGYGNNRLGSAMLSGINYCVHKNNLVGQESALQKDIKLFSDNLVFFVANIFFAEFAVVDQLIYTAASVSMTDSLLTSFFGLVNFSYDYLME